MYRWCTLCLCIVYTMRNQVFLVFNQQRRKSRRLEFSSTKVYFLKHKTHPKTHLNNIAIFFQSAFFARYVTQKKKNGKAMSAKRKRNEMKFVVSARLYLVNTPLFVFLTWMCVCVCIRRVLYRYNNNIESWHCFFLPNHLFAQFTSVGWIASEKWINWMVCRR